MAEGAGHSLRSPLVPAQLLSRVQLFMTPWTVASQAPWDFSRQKYWSELPFPSSGNLPVPRIDPASPALAGRFFTQQAGGLLYKGASLIHEVSAIMT